MIRVNLASRHPCPTCGGDMCEGFDGGNDRLFEYCERERQLLRGPHLRAWWEDHDKRCPGPGKCREAPPVWRCDVEVSPPGWLASALKPKAPLSPTTLTVASRVPTSRP